MKIIQKEALELFTRKNMDYGDDFANYGANRIQETMLLDERES